MIFELLLIVFISYILILRLFQKLSMYVPDIIGRFVFILFLVFIFPKSITISAQQWNILVILFIINFLVAYLFSPKRQLYYVLIATVLAPLSEEMLFRGVVFDNLSSSAVEKIAITSVLFGLYHIKNIAFLKPFTLIYQIFYAIILGIPLALLKIKTGSLFLPIIVHSINNLLALTITARYYPKFIEKKK